MRGDMVMRVMAGIPVVLLPARKARHKAIRIAVNFMIVDRLGGG